jgi:hypothetical protein
MRLAQALDAAPLGPISLISACAGQGRDVVPVVASHPRRNDVRGRLVELDPRLAAFARDSASAAALGAIEVVEGDASMTSAYAGYVPARVALFCGVFGNISDSDIRRTVELLPTMLAANGWVIWTRHRRAPDVTPTIRQWFAGAGFSEVAFDTDPATFHAVGTNQLVAPPQPAGPLTRMFTFSGDGAAAVDEVPSP